MDRGETMNFNELKQHIGHKIVCVSYGKGKNIKNVSVECEDCFEVIISIDKEVKQ